MKKTSKKIISILLSAILILSNLLVAFATDTKKDETVYVMLNSDGSIKNQIVSSWIHNDSGIKNMKEKVALTDIRNVKSDIAPSLNDGYLSWNMDGNDVYYQGVSSKKPPISMKITYKLNGKDISANELAGKSGNVEINIQYKNNERSSVVINGKSMVVSTPMAVSTICNFNSDDFKNVTCSNAKILSDGNHQAVFILTIPGLKESLGSSYDLLTDTTGITLQDEFTITCDTTNFKLSSIMTAVTTDLPLDKLKKSVDFNQLSDSLIEMKDASNKLVDGNNKLTEGIQTFSQKMNELETNYQTFGSGIEKLNQGSKNLSQGSRQVSDGVKLYTNSINDIFHSFATKMPEIEKQLGTLKKTLNSNITAVGTDAKATSQEMQSIMTQLSVLMAQIDQLEKSDHADQAVVKSLKETAATLYKELTNHAKTLHVLGDDVKQLAGSAEKLSGDLNQQYAQIKAKLGPMQKELAQKSAMLNSGAAKVSEGAKALNDGTSGLSNGSQKLNSGISQLNDASKTLSEKSALLNDGMKTFKSKAVDQLEDKVGNKITDAEDLIELKDVLVKRSEQYTTYSGKPENCKSTVNFVMKTDAIEVDEAVPAEIPVKNKPEEKQGFFEKMIDSIKNLFSKD